MVTQNIYVRDIGWSIRCYFDTTSEDAEEILDELWYLGCDVLTYRKAERNLLSGKKDTGLCYSNYARRETIFVISQTSSALEFINSWVHEMRHLIAHVTDVCKFKPLGENIAYFSGEVARQMFPKIKHFICDCCRSKQLNSYDRHSH